MVLVNYTSRELTAKLVYYGPGLCGKTTNLQFIYDHLLPEEGRGQLVSLATETDRTLFFDFLALEIGTIRSLTTRLQLYTVPGQVHYNATRKIVLKGADGIVFVADSQRTARAANLESYENMKANLAEHGVDLAELPLVFQFNKRDLPDIMPVEQMEADLNEFNVPFWEAIAVNGIGVEDTLKGVSRLVMKNLAARFQTEAPAVAEPEPVREAPRPIAPAPPARAPAAVSDRFGPLEIELDAEGGDRDILELEEQSLVLDDAAPEEVAAVGVAAPADSAREAVPTFEASVFEDALPAAEDAFRAGDTILSDDAVALPASAPEDLEAAFLAGPSGVPAASEEIVLESEDLVPDMDASLRAGDTIISPAAPAAPAAHGAPAPKWEGMEADLATAQRWGKQAAEPFAPSRPARVPVEPPLPTGRVPVAPVPAVPAPPAPVASKPVVAATVPVTVSAAEGGERTVQVPLQITDLHGVVHELVLDLTLRIRIV